MEYRILGSLEVISHGRVLELGPPKQRAVLAVLLLHAGEILPTDRLIEQVWGDRPPRTAAHSVQIYVSELRRALEPVAGGPVIETRPPGYAIRVEPGWVDSRRFERLVAEGAREVEAGDPSHAVTTLEEALRLWRGPPLSDFAYEEFAQPEIHRLEGLRLRAIEELAVAELKLGREQEALTMIEAALAEDPLRERTRELQMLALYRTGRHAEALRAFQRYEEALGEELGLDPSPPLRLLQERILLHDPSLAPQEVSPNASARNPYKGLRPFEEDDAEDFFGRDALVGELLEALKGGKRVIALVGPSGCGKSSVVAAGFVPALRRGAIAGSEDWTIAYTMLGARPLEELEAVLRDLPVDGPRLLVMDQFEEVFSAADAQVAARFLPALAEVTTGQDSGLRAILTLRADFYDRPLLHAEFARVFADGVVNVVPMSAGELEEAVIEPARRAGVEVEPALRAELVAETAGRPGGLPLLQYTLTELFDRREGREITLEDYRSLGGLPAIVSQRSEALYKGFDQERQRTCMQVFLRLVRLGEGTRDARRRTPLGELIALGLDPVALSDVLEAFGRRRLLTFDREPSTGEATIELAHEALLWEWERLAGWIDRHRGDLRRLDALMRAAEEWETSGLDPDYLLTGSRLADYEEWDRATSLELGARERGFLGAGLERRHAEEAEETSRKESLRRLGQRASSRLVELISEGRLAGPEVARRAPDVTLVWEGYGDGGHGEAIGAGFDQAVDEVNVHAERRVISLESRDSLGTELRRLAERGVGLIVVGSASVDLRGLQVVADDHPECRFVAADVEDDRPNVTCVSLRTEEGSFLAGAAAALKSETGIVGFIGGTDNALILKFAAGYEAGARAVRPDIQVRSVYVDPGGGFEWHSGFTDPRKTSGEAGYLYQDGADIVHHAAGASGFGVFDAAERWSTRLGRHLWAIGVDADQYESLTRMPDVPDEVTIAWRAHILTSMVKHYDVALTAVLKDYKRGVLIGGVRRFGLAEGALDLSCSGGFIDDINPELEGFRQQIIDGEIEVPTIPTRSGG